ncbi:tetratricopeptide repeat protein [Acidobacteriota bacterium]
MRNKIGAALWFVTFFVYATEAFTAFNGQIRLKILDSEKNPLEGVHVLFEHDDYGTQFERVTDKDGRLIQQVMPVGNYNTTFTKKGYAVVTGTIFIGGKDNRFMPGFPSECLISARNWKNRKWTRFKMLELEGAGESGSEGADVVMIRTEKGGIFDKGLEAFKNEDYETARSEFERILEEKPELPDTYLLLYNTYTKLNDPDKAFQILKTGVVLNPGIATAHRQLAGFYEQKGDDEAAIEEYKTALKIEPDSTFGNRDLGLIMLKKSQWKEGKRLLTRYLELAPKAADRERIQSMVTEIEKYCNP